MSDIILRMPWSCDDKDCSVGWHVATYWLTSPDGEYTVDWFSDGDHEDISPGDVPKCTEVDENTKRYANHVIKTGDDPLGWFNVPTTRTERQVWQIKLRNSVMGPVVVEVRRPNVGHRFVGKGVRNAPPHVVEYLDLDPDKNTPVVRDAKTVESLGYKPGVWTTHTIEHEVQRPIATVRAERRLRARLTIRS